MRYDEVIKKELVQQYYNGGSVSTICLQYGIPRSTFYTWVKLYRTIYTEAGYEVNATELLKLKKRVARQDQIINILKTVDCPVSAPLKEKLYALEKLHGQYSVRHLCEALDVDRGTYYNHILRNKKKNNTYQARRDELSQQIKDVFEENHQIFGAKKIKAVLAERGVYTSDKMVSELMEGMNMTSIRTSSKKVYQQRNGRGKKKDRLNMNFSVHAPNQVWVSDITAFRFNEKSYYICAILDLYSRKVISYKISERQSTQLLTSVFKRAFEERRPFGKLIFHSDRGTQYSSHKFQSLLKQMNVEQSFSPKAKPQHNAVMEAFFATMKKEELYRTNYHSIKEFKTCIKDYMEFYNVNRPHSTLSYKTPEAYEQMYDRLSQMNRS